jgi:predicted glycosyltransferase
MPTADVARVLIYSHDTFGLGHLRRCRAIAHALVARNKKLHVLIVSGSSIAGAFDFRARVDFVKIPSVIKLYNGDYTALAELIDVGETLEMRRSIILKTAEIYRPDFFIVDKEAMGLRGELEPTLTLLKDRGCRLILGLRDVLDSPELLRAEWSRTDVLDKIDRLYDEIWVYGPGNFWNPLQGLDVPPRLQERVRFMGFLRRSVPDDKPERMGELPERFVLLTVGGGGDGAEMIEQTLAARAVRTDPVLPLVMVLGPFMPKTLRRQIKTRAAAMRDVHVIEFDSHLEHLMARATAIIAMGGYNTFCEILSFDKPALLIPRTHPRREQFVRAARAQELGLVDMLTPEEAGDPARLAAAIAALPSRIAPSQNEFMPDMRGLKRIALNIADQIAALKQAAACQPNQVAARPAE